MNFWVCSFPFFSLPLAHFRLSAAETFSVCLSVLSAGTSRVLRPLGAVRICVVIDQPIAHLSWPVHSHLAWLMLADDATKPSDQRRPTIMSSRTELSSKRRDSRIALSAGATGDNARTQTSELTRTEPNSIANCKLPHSFHLTSPRSFGTGRPPQRSRCRELRGRKNQERWSFGSFGPRWCVRLAGPARNRKRNAEIRCKKI